ncbi:MAG TPA: prepilin-type N-terminal cleavage/methylation domain-containing protein [Pirellulaceae bacterium]|nr:prepilin-type N-terminal cleavage/methylation domain-containing protein [Pirellulaceae bacterium]
MMSRRTSDGQNGPLAPRVAGQVENLSYAGNRPAFTLVELMVVVVIAIILMAVTLPSVKYSLEEGKLREGARQFNAYFAVAKARATTTGRPAGVWLELEQIGDPNAALGSQLYQCSQLYLAEVPATYGGDTLDARCIVTGTAVPYALNFQNNCAASLQNLVTVDGEMFFIRFDYKGHYFRAQRNNANSYSIIDTARVPPTANTAGYAFQIFRQPARIGQPLELPQGIVIDPNYSGASPTGFQFEAAKRQILVMFSPAGGVASVAYTEQYSGNNNTVEIPGTSKIHFLVGKTEKMFRPWDTTASTLMDHNISDGTNLWVTINRRNGSVGTVENVPSFNPQDYNPQQNFPPTNPQERQAFLQMARQFATGGEVKGGQ